jgi:hypothetical protein
LFPDHLPFILGGGALVGAGALWSHTPTHYATAIHLVKVLVQGFYVHLTISQPTLKEPTPGSFN